jgi:diguanylate cyclase (GGDEF)-like protein
VVRGGDRLRGAAAVPDRAGRRPSAPAVADPARGTGVAIAFPAAAAAILAAWADTRGWGSSVSVPALLALLAVAGAAERIAVQLGPRSWYTASAPAIVLAGLLAGPTAGAAAAVATQIVRPEAVWRRRFAEGGLGAVQGALAGMVGTVSWAGGGVAAEVALALGAAIVVNTLGRLLILLERRRTPLVQIWLRGIVVDGLESAVVLPLLAVIVVAYAVAPVLALGSAASLLAALLLAQRLRELHLAELAAEQANARRDQLTGAPNRRAFAEALAREHERIVRGSHPAGLFVVDLDHFKSINDGHGHGVGDEVLVSVVRRLGAGLRGTDLVARWGGEELTILAPGLGSRRALEDYAERIRRLVGDAPVRTRTGVLAVTVSVGGTRLDGSLSPEAALRQADMALYDAKRLRDASVVALPQLDLRLVTA